MSLIHVMPLTGSGVGAGGCRLAICGIEVSAPFEFGELSDSAGHHVEDARLHGAGDNEDVGAFQRRQRRSARKQDGTQRSRRR
eukprot:7387339-Prymnesium_polylepis.1